MNIYITGGNINSYYVQTLCLLYFPGERFKENENTRWCRISVERNGNSSESTVEIGETADGPVFCGHGSISTSSLTAEDEAKADKISVGIAFAEAAGKLTGYRPPWGILTGVRPARVVSALTASGLSAEAAERYLCNIYGVAPQKAHLAAEVSLAEARVILPEQKRRCSIYIAIPFCPSRCRYCSFVSVSSPRLLKLIPEYLAALMIDLENVMDTVRHLGLTVDTVYVGGGTPTVLDETQISELLEYIRRTVGDGITEFTFEAGRPDTLTEEKLSAIVNGGVTRISVNTQTLNDSVLAEIGRNHTADDFFRAYELARSSGVPQINVDLIAGLPKESSDSFISAVDKVIGLKPEDITVHTFTVKRASEYGLSELYSRESLDAATAVDGAAELLGSAGYMPYYMYRQKNTVGNLENVGYSLRGCECLYNIYMMEEVHTVFGVGASSVTRLTLTDDVTGEQYIERIFEPKYPYEYLKDYSGDEGDRRRRLLRESSAEFYKNHL